MLPRLALVSMCLGFLAGCGGGGPSATPPVVLPPAPDRFAEVDRIATEAFATAAIPGMGLAIYDAQDRKVFERMYGDFAPDRRVAVASASKVVSGLVLLRLVDQGFLSLDATTGSVLGWSGPQADITLRHLLSFTSGLPTGTIPAAAPCINDAGVTLADCVREIADVTPVAAPGMRFDYGSTHLHVAARMAEVVTGATWNEVFAAQIGRVLGLPDEVTYFTAPRQAVGTTNPLVAGGLRASMDEYGRMLSVVFQRGTWQGQRLAAAVLFDEQAREPYPSVIIGASPVADLGLSFRYGLSAWLECDTPATGCAVLSSPGAFGWTPWVDRDAGYYAILGMEVGLATSGVTQFSVELAQALQPAIRAALAP